MLGYTALDVLRVRNGAEILGLALATPAQVAEQTGSGLL